MYAEHAASEPVFTLSADDGIEKIEELAATARARERATVSRGNIVVSRGYWGSDRLGAALKEHCHCVEIGCRANVMRPVSTSAPRLSVLVSTAGGQLGAS